MLNIKALAMATAVSAGAVFAVPALSQAMPTTSPVNVQTVNDSNVVDVTYRKHWNRWASYCRYHNDWRCRRHYTRYYRYRYYGYDEPYYGYYRPYYRPYRPGIGFHFNID